MSDSPQKPGLNALATLLCVVLAWSGLAVAFFSDRDIDDTVQGAGTTPWINNLAGGVITDAPSFMLASSELSEVRTMVARTATNPGVQQALLATAGCDEYDRADQLADYRWMMLGQWYNQLFRPDLQIIDLGAVQLKPLLEAMVEFCPTIANHALHGKGSG